MPSHLIDNYKESETYADLQLKYDQYLSDTAELLPTSVNFHTFYYKTKTVEGSCDDWRYVTESLLVPPSEEFYISQLSVSFDTQHDISRYYADTQSTYVCNDAVAIALLADELLNGDDNTDAEYHCDNQSWRVFTCNSARILCVNCKLKCVPTVTCPGAVEGFVFNPCEKRCEDGKLSSFEPNQATAWSIMSAQFAQKKLYPQYELLDIVDVMRTGIRVAVNSTKEGFIHCSAFPVRNGESLSINSVSTIRNAPSASFIEVISSDIGLTQTIEVTGLVPDTDHRVYCFSEDYANHVMIISEVLEHVLEARTTCCRTIKMKVSHDTIQEYQNRRRRLQSISDESLDLEHAHSKRSIMDFPLSLNGSRPLIKQYQKNLHAFRMLASLEDDNDPVYTFALDSLPDKGNIQVTSSLHYTDCENPGDIGSLVSTRANEGVLPGAFTFASTSPSPLSNFIVRSRPGCYAVVLTATSNSGANTYEGTQVNIVVMRSTKPPLPPRLVRAQLSNDGEKVTIGFHLPTDKGKTVEPAYLNPSGFWCGSIMQFNGSGNATCKWQSSQVLIATFHPSEKFSRVQVGEGVSIIPNTLKSECIPQGDLLQSACDNALYATERSMSLPLQAPADAMRPKVVLQTSDLISSCNNIIIDPRMTEGKGSLPWKEAIWSIDRVDFEDPPNIIPTANNKEIIAMSVIRSKLQATGTNLNDMVVIYVQGTKWSVQGWRYRIGLKLTNSMGMTASVQKFVRIADSAATPSVTIAGLPSLNKFRNQSISLFANASIDVSECTGVDSFVLNYAWKVYKVEVGGPKVP